MKRFRGIQKKYVESSESSSEDDHGSPPKKASPSAHKKVNDESSSSESDIGNYLQKPEKLDLDSEFFSTGKVSEFGKIENKIFDGVSRLSESDSDIDDSTNENAIENEAKERSQAKNDIASCSKRTFNQLQDYTNKIEEAKRQVEIYKAKKKAKESQTDIFNLLAAGEKKTGLEESITAADLHSSDFESCESDQEGWEEIKSQDRQENLIPSKGLQITVDMPDRIKKKKGVDLMAALKRRLNRIRKENQILVHKVHLLCWIAHGNYVNVAVNDTQTMAMALSLLPSEQCYPSDRTDLSYLEQIVAWYKKNITLKDKSAPDNMPVDRLLQDQINKKVAYNKEMMAIIFVTILRALGIQARIVVSLQVEPLRPPASELHSISTKDAKDKKKSSEDKNKSSIASTQDENHALGKTGDSSIKNILKNPSDQKSNTNIKVDIQKPSPEKNNSTAKPRARKRSAELDIKKSLAEKHSTQSRSKSTGNISSDKNASENHKSLVQKNSETLNAPKNKRRTKSAASAENAHGEKFVNPAIEGVKPKLNSSKKHSGESTHNVVSTPNNSTENPIIYPTRKSKSSLLIETKDSQNSDDTRKTRTRNIKAADSKSGSKLGVQADSNSVGPKTRERTSNVKVVPESVEAKNKSSRKTKSTRKSENKEAIPQVDGLYDSDSDAAEVILQIDGANDKLESQSKSKPNLKTLKNPVGPAKHIKKAPKKPNLKLLSAEANKSESLRQKVADNSNSDFDPPSDSDSEFEPSNGGQFKIQLKKATPGLNKLKNINGKLTRQLDVKDDIVNLVKKRIVEKKLSDRSRVDRKRKSNLYSDYDSDYVPEPVKKKYHDSDDEFVPKTKVKRRVQVRPVLSDSDTEKKKKQGNDVWVEVFLEAEEKWISVDVVFGQVHCVKEISKRASHPITYVLAWDNNNNIKDVTQRYCPNFNTVTRKLRIDPKWWNDSLKPFKGIPTARDKEEDDDLARQQMDQPLPKSVAEYKNHPLYALKRHLLKFEAIYPPNPPTLGFIRGEAVYPRGCVFTLHSRDIWLKQAKVVKLGEQPYKIVKARPKWDKLFRMEKTSFIHFVNVISQVDLNKILEKRYTSGHYPLDRNIQVLIFLHYMATQETLFSIGHRFQVSTSTVMMIVNKLLYLTLKLERNYIHFPTLNELQYVSEGFTNYPGVVGAIDGTHIFISINEAQDSYIDRYRRHSINIMAICDSNQLLTYVMFLLASLFFFGFPGAAHDFRVFENSQLFLNIERFGANQIFLNDDQYHLIGDSDFSLKKKANGTLQGYW